MPGQNDLGPFGPGVNATTEEPASFGDSGTGDYTWFQDCSSPTSDDGTRFTAQWANRILKYIRRAADGMNIARGEGDMDRLLKAIQKAIRPASNIGLDEDGVGVFKETDAGTLTHMLRRLKGIGGIGVTLDESGNVINVDGSGIAVTALAPIFPEVETADNKLTVTAGSGQVIVGAEQTFIHRGARRIDCNSYSAGARTFNTSANKTYHLRWRWNDGVPAFSLNDLSNVGYNAGSLAEGAGAFDSTYDDMLIAKVETNGSNGITITSLRNKHVLREVRTNVGTISGTTANAKTRTASETYNWARTPDLMPNWWLVYTAGVGASNGLDQFPGSATHDHDEYINITAVSRYGWSLTLLRDYAYNMDIRVLMLA